MYPFYYIRYPLPTEERDELLKVNMSNNYAECGRVDA